MTIINQSHYDTVPRPTLADRSGWLIIPLFLSGFSLVALIYLLLIPRWLPYDEPSHFYYVAHLVGLPGFPHPQPLDNPGLDYELYIQPPLAYLLYSPFLKMAFGLGVGAQLFILRLVTLGLGVTTVFLNLQLITILVGNHLYRRALLFSAGALMAFNPAFIAVCTTVNNDALYLLLTSAALLTGAGLMRPALPIRAGWKLVCLGILLGLAGATKALALPLLPLPLVVVALRYRFYQRERLLLRWLLPALLAALLVAGPPYLANIITYGEPFGTGIWMKINPQAHPMRLDELGPLFPHTFTSFWFFVTYLRNSLLVKPTILEYIPFLFLNLLPVAALCKIMKVPLLAIIKSKQVKPLGLLRSSFTPETSFICIALLLHLAGFILKNLPDFSPNGRFFFGVIGPLSWLIVVSIVKTMPNRPRLLGAIVLFMLGYALYAAIFYVGQAPDLFPNLYQQAGR